MARRKPTSDPENIEFVFRYACVNCSLNPEVFDDEDQVEVRRILASISKEIHIDRTYVEFKGTRFEKTFLTESGWKTLCELVKGTGYGKKVGLAMQEILSNAYKKMIVCYIESFFKDLGWDTDNMIFDMAEDAKFMVEYFPGTSEYKDYVGKWQTWQDRQKPPEEKTGSS